MVHEIDSSKAPHMRVLTATRTASDDGEVADQFQVLSQPTSVWVRNAGTLLPLTTAIIHAFAPRLFLSLLACSRKHAGSHRV